MRVLHVIKATGIAGAERHLLMLLPALRARGVDARLLILEEAVRPQLALFDQMRALGVPTERRVMGRHLDLLLMPRLTSVFRRECLALVHAHLPHAHLYAVPAAKAAGTRIVASVHNDDPFIRRFPFPQVYRVLWRMTDAVIAISQAVAAFCRDVESAPAERLHVIHYGVTQGAVPADRKRARLELSRLAQIPQASHIVGLVGRLVPQKGVHYGIQAFAQVASRFPDVHFVIIGDGTQRDALEEETRQLGLTARVHFLGWREDAATLMSGFDIFLLPSLWEGFGLVFLEAMAASVPIIASRVSAVPEVVLDGETGLLTEPRSPTEIALALERLLQDAPLRHHMGLLGQERLETLFNIDTMVEKTLALYHRVTG